jgi:two-component system, response regulator RegA
MTADNPTRTSAISLLLVDDDTTLRERMARAFQARGYDVRTAGSTEEALGCVKQDPPELAIIDLRMPGRSGLELLREMLAADPATRVLVLTGYGSIATAVQATRQGAIGYLSKPAGIEEILAAFDNPEGPPASTTLEAPSLARVEWEHIHRVLADCDDNISEAARRLGIHRRSLQRKLQKYPPPR